MKLALPVCALSIFLLLGCSSNNGSSDASPLIVSDQQNLESDGTPVIVGADLLDVVWEMQSYTNADGQQTPVEAETTYQFRFNSGSRGFDAFIGCVNYHDSTYDLMDGFIVFKLGIRNEVECITDSDFISQGRAISSLIEGGEGAQSLPLMYSVNDTVLHLDSGDGRRLAFTEVPELVDEF